MKSNIKQNSGFTIVELLIVIVVIAILAAISIVAYNGIQNRGKTSSGASLAGQIAKKAEAYNTIASSYPADVTAFNAASSPTEARIDNPSSVLTTATAPTTSSLGAANEAAGANGGKRVAYRYCAATTSPDKAAGAAVYYWDYSQSSIQSTQVGGGC